MRARTHHVLHIFIAHHFSIEMNLHPWRMVWNVALKIAVSFNVIFKFLLCEATKPKTRIWVEWQICVAWYDKNFTSDGSSWMTVMNENRETMARSWVQPQTTQCTINEIHKSLARTAMSSSVGHAAESLAFSSIWVETWNVIFTSRNFKSCQSRSLLLLSLRLKIKQVLSQLLNISPPGFNVL